MWRKNLTDFFQASVKRQGQLQPYFYSKARQLRTHFKVAVKSYASKDLINIRNYDVRHLIPKICSSQKWCPNIDRIIVNVTLAPLCSAWPSEMELSSTRF